MKFQNAPPHGQMTRKHQMKRLEKKLVDEGYYVHPVYLSDTYSEYKYLIVSIDDPYEHQGQDQG